MRALVAEAERVGADALVAFGGGSPIDACKVAAASLLNRRDMTLAAGEIDFDGASRAGGAGREIELVAVPTTLSAGEFTPGGGVTDETTRVKRIVADARLQHRTVIYDRGKGGGEGKDEDMREEKGRMERDGSVGAGSDRQPSALVPDRRGTPTSVGSVRGWACRTRSATRSGCTGTADGVTS